MSRRTGFVLTVLAVMLIAIIVIALVVGKESSPQQVPAEAAADEWTDSTAYIKLTSEQSFLFSSAGDTDTITAEVRRKIDDTVIPDVTLFFNSTNTAVVSVSELGVLVAQTASASSASIIVEAIGLDLTPGVANVIVAQLRTDAHRLPSASVISFDPATSTLILAATQETRAIGVGDAILGNSDYPILNHVVAIDSTGSQIVITLSPTVAPVTSLFNELSVTAMGTPKRVTFDPFSNTTTADGDDAGRRRASRWDCDFEKDLGEMPAVNGFKRVFDLLPMVDLKIGLNGFVPEVTLFELYIQGTISVGLTPGASLTIAGVAASAKATCTFHVADFAFQAVTFFGVFGFGPSIGLDVGIATSASASAGLVLPLPSFNIGARLKVGVAYTPARGIYYVKSFQSLNEAMSFSGMTDPIQAEFSASLEPFVELTLSSDFIVGTKGLLGVGLVNAKRYVGVEASLKSPFSYEDFDYTGPVWKAYAGVYLGADPLKKHTDEFNEYATEFLGLDLQLTIRNPELLKRQWPLLKSPDPSLDADLGLVVINSAKDTVHFDVTTGGHGEVRVLGHKLDEDNDGAPSNSPSLLATINAGPRGMGSAAWKPTEDDEGAYKVRALSFTDGFGDIGLPYASSSNKPSVAVLLGLLVEVDPPQLSHGVAGAEYEFAFNVLSVPPTLSSVTIEWNFQVGAPGRLVLPVADASAQHTVTQTFPDPGDYLLTLQALDDSGVLLGSASASIHIDGVTLEISPSRIDDGEVDVQYDFYFFADGIDDPGVTEVTFSYNFGTGVSGSTGSAVVSVAGTGAGLQRSNTYTQAGAYGLSVDVRINGVVVASAVATVLIDAEPRDETDLDACDYWSVTKSGGQGVIIDSWDVSAIPLQATFDIEFDPISVPDRLFVDYAGSQVLDTQWRGSQSEYQNTPPLYPGPYGGPAYHVFTDVFTRVTTETFTITVVGPDPGTAWSYRVRCRYTGP